jgi:aldehyde dehydrogenase (NAD+)
MINRILEKLDLAETNKGGFNGQWLSSGKVVPVVSPIDGRTIASVQTVTENDAEMILSECHEAFRVFKSVPAPRRGEIVKQIGAEIAAHKQEIATLVTYEMGKCYREALGEVQEMIDIFDFAVGLSRQLHGLTMPSERRRHRMQEQWLPLGMTGVVTAFNFPVAVWSWNVALALVCGNTVLWKPSSKTPLSAIACIKIAERVLRRNDFPAAVCSLIIGPGRVIGDRMVRDKRVALVSYTGSVRLGREVGKIVQDRFGKHILELGGNNAVIVTPSGDLDIALKAVYFGAIGTAGQRCTSTRRVIIHQSRYAEFVEKLTAIYAKTSVGDPMDDAVLMGPLVDSRAVDTMMAALETLRQQGGNILHGGKKLTISGGCYVTPCLAEVDHSMPIVQEETFAPILYLMRYNTIEEAIAMNNDVPQGLSSAIISNHHSEIELFLSEQGSDCGIANVNTGTSGAEIGGAFGGEKETGGGRESGSDAWKAYMRRQTSSINYSGGIELAQNIQLDI